MYCCGPSLVNGIDDEEQQACLSSSLNCCESGYRARHRLRSKTTETSVNHGAAHFTIRRFGSRGALCKDGLCRGYIKRGRKTHVRQDNATLRRCVKLCTFNQEETITVVIMTVGSRSTWISKSFAASGTAYKTKGYPRIYAKENQVTERRSSFGAWEDVGLMRLGPWDAEGRSKAGKAGWE